MEVVIEQLIAGDMTHRQFFIEQHHKKVRNFAGRYLKQRGITGGEDYVSESYLTLCKIPDELAAGRYKNEPTENGVWKYIAVRLVTACQRWRLRNHLLHVPYSTLARNPGKYTFTRITHVMPGECINGEKTQHVPIPIFDLLSSKDDEEEPQGPTLMYVGLTGVEARMVIDMKEGMTVNAMATKYYVSRQTIWSRIKSIADKIIIKKDHR